MGWIASWLVGLTPVGAFLKKFWAYLFIVGVCCIGLGLVWIQINGHFEKVARTETQLATANQTIAQDAKDRDLLRSRLTEARDSYQKSLTQQQTVFTQAMADRNKVVQSLADRVDRVETLGRDFAQAKERIAHAKPEDDAPAAPVLDGAADFVRDYRQKLEAGAGGEQANPDDGHGVRQSPAGPGAVPVPVAGGGAAQAPQPAPNVK